MNNMRFDVEASMAALPCQPGTAQVVFHGINKSGSLAMAKVIQEAHAYVDRQSEFISHYHRGGQSEDFVNEINGTSATRSFVVGHGLFGALEPKANRIWVTQFRHPLPRTLSCYQWLKRNHEAKSDEPFASLEEFVTRSSGIGHSQISQLGIGNGPRRVRRRKQLTSENLFDISVDMLHANIGLIGIAEFFEESIFAFAAICGLPSVTTWKRDNRNRGRRPSTELLRKEISLIEECYSYDYKLYQHALTLFHQQNAKLGIESEALAAYRRACEPEYKDRIT